MKRALYEFDDIPKSIRVLSQTSFIDGDLDFIFVCQGLVT